MITMTALTHLRLRFVLAFALLGASAGLTALDLPSIRITATVPAAAEDASVAVGSPSTSVAVMTIYRDNADLSSPITVNFDYVSYFDQGVGVGFDYSITSTAGIALALTNDPLNSPNPIDNKYYGSGTVVIPQNEVSVYLIITPLHNGVIMGGKTVTVQITNSVSYLIDSQGSTSVVIVEGDQILSTSAPTPVGTKQDIFGLVGDPDYNRRAIVRFTLNSPRGFMTGVSAQLSGTAVLGSDYALEYQVRANPDFGCGTGYKLAIDTPKDSTVLGITGGLFGFAIGDTFQFEPSSSSNVFYRVVNTNPNPFTGGNGTITIQAYANGGGLNGGLDTDYKSGASLVSRIPAVVNPLSQKTEQILVLPQASIVEFLINPIANSTTGPRTVNVGALAYPDYVIINPGQSTATIRDTVDTVNIGQPVVATLPQSNKPIPGSINTGAKGGCGMGSGFATFAGLMALLAFYLRLRSRRRE